MTTERPKLFADTSEIKELRKLLELGIFKGITTNPIIVAKEAGKSNPRAYYQKLTEEFPDYPVSIQLLDADIPTLIKQGKEYAQISPNVVIKVPMFGDGKGLTVIRSLMDEDIKINVTAMMNAEQALLASIAGSSQNSNSPEYLSLFFNRIRDAGGNPNDEISRTRALIDDFNLDSQIISGSIRSGKDVYDAILAGTHIVTVPPKIVWQMVEHHKSVEFITQSQENWENFLQQSSK